ncbi:diacylglycerol/lipid kinase family protein [Phytohabitans kaempferiae]|uniref:Diacylglycerol/lipid kinase family protein n=1 Tax=Phytohabitans kaempferiae TaxID=1620943 RepID=A0ABV6M2K5_9ACTN
MRSKIELQDAIHRARRAVLIVNTHSRRGRRLYEVVRGRLAAEGFHLLGCFPVENTERLPGQLAAAIALDPDLLVAGGGDGTVSEAARHLAHRDIALGVLPLGTTNNFARALAVPHRPAGALGVLTGGKVADVDLGQAGETIFANHANVGLSAQVGEAVPARLKRHIGKSAYPLTAVARLLRHRPFRARITAGGDEYEVVTHQLNIVNGRFQAGRPITSDATVDDRVLHVFPVGGPRRRQLLSASLRQAFAGQRQPTAPPFLATDDLTVETDPPLPLDVDGEVHGRTPIRVRLLPNALRVMVAPSFVDN